jgi:hypothetical protein
MNKKVFEKIKGFGGNPFFVEFLIEWTRSEAVDFQTEKFVESYLKKIKRRAFRDGGKDYWIEIKKKCLKPRLKLILQKNLFKKTINPPNPRHRRRNYGFWLLVHYLREYFKKITGRPQIKLICEILCPKFDYFELNSEFYKRKNWFSEEIPIDNLLKFYEANEKIIKQVLRTGIPFYEMLEKRI